MNMAPPYPPLMEWEFVKEESEMEDMPHRVSVMWRQLPPFTSDVDEVEEEEDEEEENVDVMVSKTQSSI